MLAVMDHLRQEQLDALRQQLVEEQARLRERQVSEDATAVSEQEIGDIQDKASEEARRSTAFVRRTHNEGRLLEVEAALKRMADGTYGICEETDEPIPLGRLQAEPTTRYTVEALELLEEEREHHAATTHGANDTDVY